MRLTGPLILWNYFSPLMILAAYPAEELGMHNNPECTGRVYLFATSQQCENKCCVFVTTYVRACWGCSERRYELAENCCDCQCPVLDRTWHSSSCEEPVSTIITVIERLPPCNTCKQPFNIERQKMQCLNCHAINNKMTSWQSLCNRCAGPQ
ncbi:hypothetical protein PGTUg99_013049 [Puccinia graminis f. sp. tritici]|uniref:Uncharacterized protein n=1 Tax=Puccinia graminis f. sp. tritici TaxID=56615 RepID=A0A5B0SNJ8_PUCGR|nr:hypothetical protein PGTUg99_013049 [Puccinia graminis f. sp. tritici]